MAKSNPTKPAAAKAASGSPKKAAVKRSAAELKSTLKGRLFLLARVAFNVVNKATKKSPKDEWGSFDGVYRLEKSKFPNGPFYSATKQEAAFWKLDDSSETIKTLRAAAAKAKDDVAAGKNTPAVKAYLSELMKIQGEAGERSYNTGIVSDLTF